MSHKAHLCCSGPAYQHPSGNNHQTSTTHRPTRQRDKYTVPGTLNEWRNALRNANCLKKRLKKDRLSHIILTADGKEFTENLGQTYKVMTYHLLNFEELKIEKSTELNRYFLLVCSMLRGSFSKMKMILIIFLILSGVNLSFADEPCVDGVDGCLFGWNNIDDDNLNWKHWTYFDPMSEYGARGFMMNEDNPIWSGTLFNWANPFISNPPNWVNGGRTRMMSKGADGLGHILAKIDTNQRSPSTSLGNSFKVYDSGLSTDYAASWWMWYDGAPLSVRNITDADTDRMSFYLKTEGMDPLSTPTNIDVWGYHIGTYLCWDGTGPVYGTGDGCPYEGPGNQHYYHYLGINPGAWIHVELEQHPQHLRGSYVVGNNPSYILSGKNYFEQLFQFYMEIRHHQSQVTSMNLDEMKFYSTINSVEPNQNEDSITSVWVGFWQTDDYWEIGFSDNSFKNTTGYNDNSWSTFEIKYSTEPITNVNYDSATLVEPMYYSGTEYTDGRIGAIRRASSYGVGAWTRFNLPDDIESNHNKIYFAIKDISIAGTGAGSKWPWTRLDGHNAPTNNIRTIDYDIRPSAPIDIRSEPFSWGMFLPAFTGTPK